MGRIKFKSAPNKRVRKLVFEGDDFTCRSCSWRPSNVPNEYDGDRTIMDAGKWLEVDHIIPVISGGTNDLSNLQTLCNVCNCIKGVSTGG